MGPAEWISRAWVDQGMGHAIVTAWGWAVGNEITFLAGGGGHCAIAAATCAARIIAISSGSSSL